MLFKEKEYRFCACCAHAVDCGEEMLCRKKGPVSKDGVCRAFRYDPLKRQRLGGFDGLAGIFEG